MCSPNLALGVRRESNSRDAVRAHSHGGHIEQEHMRSRPIRILASDIDLSAFGLTFTTR